jgi:hypothetical protein
LLKVSSNMHTSFAAVARLAEGLCLNALLTLEVENSYSSSLPCRYTNTNSVQNGTVIYFALRNIKRKRHRGVAIRTQLFENLKNSKLNHNYVKYHHHMALQPMSGPDLPCWGFLIITFLEGWIVSQAPNPQPGGPGLRIYDPRRQGGPAIPPGTRYTF